MKMNIECKTLINLVADVRIATERHDTRGTDLAYRYLIQGIQTVTGCVERYTCGYLAPTQDGYRIDMDDASSVHLGRGDYMDVWIADRWIPTTFQRDISGCWYLSGARLSKIAGLRVRVHYDVATRERNNRLYA